LNLSICDQGNWQMALIGSNSLDVDSILAQFPGPIRLTAGKNQSVQGRPDRFSRV
jgi:hypothetical protein